MSHLLARLPLLFAQDANAPPPAGGDANGFLFQLLPFLPVVVLFYLLVLRPSQQQDKKRQEMIKQLKRNDRVVTSAGIYGTVASVDEAGDRVILRVGEDDKGIRIAFTRASIVKVVEVAGEKPVAAV